MSTAFPLMSNYPNGFANGVTVRGMPLLSAYPGAVFWVDSVNGADGNDGTFGRPWATIDYAIGLCTASRGDIIVAKAGHAETLTAAAGILFDIAGVALIGLGSGSLRPTISYGTATSASLRVTAANCSIMNVLFVGVLDALLNPLDLRGADFSLLNCEYRDTSATQAVDTILTTAGATRLVIDGYVHNGDAAAGATSAIAIVGLDRPIISNFRINGNFSSGAIEFRTTASTNAEVFNGYIWTKNANDLCIKDTVTGSTGRVGPNLYLMLTDNAANITEAITAATFQYFPDIMVCNLAGELAIQINTTASADL